MILPFGCMQLRVFHSLLVELYYFQLDPLKLEFHYIIFYDALGVPEFHFTDAVFYSNE